MTFSNLRDVAILVGFRLSLDLLDNNTIISLLRDNSGESVSDGSSEGSDANSQNVSFAKHLS